MFVNLKFDGTVASNATNHQAFMEDLSNILKGTLTDPANCTSPFINKADSTITGSLNTSLYTIDDSTWYDLKIRKYHHGKTIGYDPSSIARLFWNTGTRPTARTQRADGTAEGPGSSSLGNYWSWGSHPTGAAPNTYPDYYDKMMIAASDYWLIIQLQHNTYNICTYALLDYEATATDIHAFQNMSNLVSPQVTFVEQVDYMQQDVYDANAYPLLWRNTYVTKQGIVRNGESQILGDACIGSTGPSAHYAYQFHPQMRTTMAPQPLFGGDGHLMQPVYVHSESDVREQTSAPGGMGKVPYFYRTTDNISQTGDIITMGADNYVSFQFHKCGGDSLADTATFEVAHYLVPVTIGGV